MENSAAGHMAPLKALIGDMVEIAIRVRILQRAMFSKTLNVIGPLVLMQKSESPPVGAGQHLALGAKIQSPSVATPLGKQFEFFADGMKAPNALLEGEASDLGGYGTPLGTIQPAIRAPNQRVSVGVGILHAKPVDQHFGITIGNIITVFVRIKEQIGGLKDINPPITDGKPGCQI